MAVPDGRAAEPEPGGFTAAELAALRTVTGMRDDDRDPVVADLLAVLDAQAAVAGAELRLLAEYRPQGDLGPWDD